MAKDFMKNFNEITGYEFEYLVLKSVDVEVKQETFVVNLIYPEVKEQEVRASVDRITDGVLKALKLKAMVKVKVVKSHFDEDLFRRELIKFTEKSPSVAPYVFVDEIKIEKLDKYEFAVEIAVDEDIINNSPFVRYVEDVKAMLACHYCEKISFKLTPKKIVDKVDEIAKREKELAEYVYQSNDGRFIVPQNVEEFIGKIIYDRASYIVDAISARDDAVFCGTVSDFTECQTKKRSEDDLQRTFFKFTLTDPTGSLACLFFPRSSGKTKEGKARANTQENIVLLKDGMQVVVKGKLTENTFRGNTTYDMFVRNVSLCTVPTDIVIEKPKQKPIKSQEQVSEIVTSQYVEMKQASMFDVEKQVPEMLRGKRFCVFDIETTGLDTKNCKIIELGAIIVDDGKLTETFSSFVNPHESIRPDTTDLTSITDADVINAPDIDVVLADFKRFSRDTVLVGHNAISFDFPFLCNEGERCGITFENQVVDTYKMAPKCVKGIKYNLGALAKYFDVVNEHAHRAIHDAVTTAKIFVKLAELM